MAEHGRQLYGVADFRNGMNDLARKAQRGTCLLDGVEVPKAFYIDTLSGVVKTYDLRGAPGIPEAFADGKTHTSRELWAKGFLKTSDVDGAVSRTLRGKVELFAAAGMRLAGGGHAARGSG